MRKVLAVFMSVLMLVSAFSGVITVSAAGNTTLFEVALGNTTFTNSKNGSGSALTQTEYVIGNYTFQGATNGTWSSNVVNGTSADAQAIEDAYAAPSIGFSSVNASDLTNYTGIAAGHSSKFMKLAQTANVTMFRLKDFYDVSKLPATGKIKISLDVYPTDVTAGTIENTSETGVKPQTGTLSDYKIRLGDSTGTGSSDSSTVTATSVIANQWNTIEHIVELSSRQNMDSVRVDLSMGIDWLTAYTKAFPATIFFDKLKVELIGDGTTDDGTTDDGTTDDDTTDGSASVEKVKIGFENGDQSPSTDMNIWGIRADGKNRDGMQKVVNWADEASISKPDSTEDFGSKLLKVDGRTASVKGVHEGRINDIPAENVGITAGETYTYSFWVLAAETSTDAGTAKVGVYPYINGKNSNTLSLFNVSEELQKGKWKKVSGSFVATANEAGKSTGFRLRFSSIDATNYATLVYMDNFTIVEGVEKAPEVELSVMAEGNGKVTGGGKYEVGKTATLVATAESGYSFAGWYKGATLLSKEATYKYEVTADVTSIVGKFEKIITNIGDNWVTIDTIDFEDSPVVNGTANASAKQYRGTTAKGSQYYMSALNGSDASVSVDAEVLTEAQAGIGSSSTNHIYKFTKTAGQDNVYGMIRPSGMFSLKDLSVGDIIRISFKVYPTNLHTPAGVTQTPTAALSAFYSISGGYGSGAAEKKSDGTGVRYLKADEWSHIGITTTVTKEMLDAAEYGALRIENGSGASVAATLYFDDFVAEVYKDYPAADSLNVVENFDFSNEGGITTVASSFETHPYVSKVFTRKDTTGLKYTRYNTFGTGVSGNTINIVKNTSDLSGVVAHSGTSAVKWAGRWSANAALKVEDIFMGKFDKGDIGRKIRVSAWVYADKSAGAYKMTYDANQGEYVDNKNKDSAVAYTSDELKNLTKTKMSISFAGANDDCYLYRQGDYNTGVFDINWNEWTEIYTDIVITEEILDNGSNQKGKNPLICAIRIDQAAADGLESGAVADTIYIDDVSAKEVTYEVSSAIGSHMVYQKGRPIRVWGINGDIGEAVTVKFNGETKTATTDANGNWVAEFNKIDEYARNLEIEVSCPGERDVKFTDISIGEVIMASGQSNMEWNLRKVYEAEEIIADAATNENISILSLENRTTTRGSYNVHKAPKGACWSKMDVEAAKICSGIGYITAYKIAEKYDIPVAVIDANLSGSHIEPWLSAEVIEARKDDIYKSIYEDMINKKVQVSNTSIWKVHPSGMYNSFIAPFDNYEVGIMLWYQGCSNHDEAKLYNYQQYDLINSWRELFGTDETPFVICQLAPHYSEFMELRQVQLDTAKRMDNVYLVTTADLGPIGSLDKDSKLYSEMTSGNEIHPVRKIPVADRIAKTLFANYFGEEGITYSGPEYTFMEAFDDHIVLHFKHIGTGLKKIDEEKELTGFKISADNVTFVDATAEILEDNTIKVYAAGVANPKYVKYCYVPWVAPEDALTSEDNQKLGNTLGGNLTNESGIPAGPFVATLPAPTIYAAQTSTDATGINISMSVRNMGYSEANPKLIVGLYNGTKLAGLKTVDVDFKTIDTKTIDFKFYSLDTEITDETAIKAFLWEDMGTMIPLQGVYPIERNK